MTTTPTPASTAAELLERAKNLCHEVMAKGKYAAHNAEVLWSAIDVFQQNSHLDELAAIKAQQPTETGWLIEKNGNGCEWLTICKPANEPFQIEWTKDSNLAIRFSRAQDAHIALAIFVTVDCALNGYEPYYPKDSVVRVEWKTMLEKAGVTEHQWNSP